jgi:hypothetical protein
MSLFSSTDGRAGKKAIFNHKGHEGHQENQGRETVSYSNQLVLTSCLIFPCDLCVLCGEPFLFFNSKNAGRMTDVVRDV